MMEECGETFNAGTTPPSGECASRVSSSHPEAKGAWPMGFQPEGDAWLPILFRAESVGRTPTSRGSALAADGAGNRRYAERATTSRPRFWVKFLHRLRN